MTSANEKEIEKKTFLRKTQSMPRLFFLLNIFVVQTKCRFQRGIYKNFSKKAHGVEERKSGDHLCFFIIQFVAENQNNQRGDTKNFGKKVSQCRKQPVKPNLLSCPITTKTFKTMVAKDGTV